MSNNHELQDQDLQLINANQMLELDDDELDTIAGGGPTLGVSIGAAGGAAVGATTYLANLAFDLAKGEERSFHLGDLSEEALKGMAVGAVAGFFVPSP